jgi:hypothetical protein
MTTVQSGTKPIVPGILQLLKQPRLAEIFNSDQEAQR